MKHSLVTGESQTDSYHQSDTECDQMFPNERLSFSHTCDIRINQPWHTNWLVCPLSTCCIFLQWIRSQNSHWHQKLPDPHRNYSCLSVSKCMTISTKPRVHHSFISKKLRKGRFVTGNLNINWEKFPLNIIN